MSKPTQLLGVHISRDLTNFGQVNEPVSNIIMTIYGIHHAYLAVFSNIRQCCMPTSFAVAAGATGYMRLQLEGGGVKYVPTVIILRCFMFRIVINTPVLRHSS